MFQGFIDLAALVWESTQLALGEGGFGKWILIALLAAAGSFGLNLFFVRLWNRLYEAKVWHMILFGVAALGALLAAVALPATAHLKEAVQARVDAWKKMATTSEVEMEDSWNQERIKSGLAAFSEKVSWSVGLGFQTRIRLVEEGYEQGPIGGGVLVLAPGDGAASRIEFELMLDSFADHSPAVYSRINVPTEALSTQHVEWARAEFGRREQATGRQLIPYEAIVDKVASDLLEVAEPQVPSIARAIRIIAILALVLSVCFPSLLLGIVSYSQIKVGFDRRSRGERSGRSASRSRGRDPVRRARGVRRGRSRRVSQRR